MLCVVIKRLSFIYLALIVCILVPNSRVNAEPKDDILIIFNHGSADGEGNDCYGRWFNLWPRWPRWLRDINGKEVIGKRIRVETPCSKTSRGTFATNKCVGNVWVCERTNEIIYAITNAVEDGYQPQNIFVGGQSAGGWASLLIKKWNPGLFNGVIATAPAFNGRRRTRLCKSSGCKLKPQWGGERKHREMQRKWNSQMRRQHDKQLGLDPGKNPSLRALVFAFQCDPFGHPDEYPFSGNDDVQMQVFPAALASQRIGCAVSCPYYRYRAEEKGNPAVSRCESLDKQMTRFDKRCKPLIEWKPSRKMECGPGDEAPKYGVILNCPPGLEKICGMNQHTQSHRSREFANYIASENVVLEFIEKQLKKPIPENITPVHEKPCDFINMDAICGPAYQK